MRSLEQKSLEQTLAEEYLKIDRALFQMREELREASNKSAEYKKQAEQIAARIKEVEAMKVFNG